MSSRGLGCVHGRAVGVSGEAGARVSAPANIERRLARRLLRAVGSPPVRVVLWNGEEFAESADASIARIVFRDRAAFW